MANLVKIPKVMCVRPKVLDLEFQIFYGGMYRDLSVLDQLVTVMVKDLLKERPNLQQAQLYMVDDIILNYISPKT